MQGTCRKAGFTLVELIVVVGIIGLLLSMLLPTLNRATEYAARVNCANNLRQIGFAMKLYAEHNNHYYPRTRSVADYPAAATEASLIGAASGDAQPGPVNWGSGATESNPFENTGGTLLPNDVTAALYLVVRTEYISAELFICPSTADTKDPYTAGGGTPDTQANFTAVVPQSPQYLSYSYASPYPDVNARARGYRLDDSLGAEFALAADLNPGQDDAPDGDVHTFAGSTGPDDNADRDQVYDVDPSQPLTLQKWGNSNNHRREGQNVLYADGHVVFANAPFVGRYRDNIYTRQTESTIDSDSADAPSSFGGVMRQSPQNPDDSLLLPARSEP